MPKSKTLFLCATEIFLSWIWILYHCQKIHYNYYSIIAGDAMGYKRSYYNLTFLIKKECTKLIQE